jgi:predicted aspartyl protease
MPAEATLLTLLRHITIVLAWWLAASQVLAAQLEDIRRTASESAEIQLFSAPDESSPLVGSVGRAESLSPMAETLGAGGEKWHLVKTKGGMVGWLKAGNTDESKKLESFFKSLPAESHLSIPAELPEASSTTAARNSIAVPVNMTGAMVLVPVTLNHAVQTYMVLDTGASFTVISRQIASSLGLRAASQASFMTGNGVVSMPLAELKSLVVGKAEASNLTVAIRDIHPQLGGLLGLNFLSRYHASIDSRRQLLILSPR